MNDGSRHRVYKRFFRAAQLAREIAVGEILHEGHWFVVAEKFPDPGRSKLARDLSAVAGRAERHSAASAS
jgi:hypothetical protein